MAWVGFALATVWWWFGDLRRRWRAPGAWVSFLIESAPPELAPPAGPRWRRLLGRPPGSLRDLARDLRQVAADRRVRGVLVNLRPMDLSGARTEALAGLLAELRAAGKEVVCWATSYTASTFRVACAAGQVFVQPGGGIGPLGVSREYVFLADALARYGVAGDFVQVSPYKTAADTITRSRFSDEGREMAGWLADAAFAEQLAAIGTGRGLDEAAVRGLVDSTPCTDLEAVRLGAVDGAVSEEDLAARLGAAAQPWAAVRRRLRRPRPVAPGRVVGLIRVEGTIVDGRSRAQPPLAPPLPVPLLLDSRCGDLTVVDQARALAGDRRVASVLLWIDSPGGSAAASEAMASALAALATRKPVVAAMGTVAASGGYYVATPATRILAHPGTVTGSIGVLAGKVTTGGLLDRLLVGREPVERGRNAGFFTATRPFSREERERLGILVDRSYRLFLERVAAARRLPVEQVEPLAGGRVWTGRQALANGLVDGLATFEEALTEARRLGALGSSARLREARGGGTRAPVPALAPAPGPGAGALFEHMTTSLEALNRAAVWLLSPWWLSR